MKNDTDRILTCFFDYHETWLNVTGLLYERTAGSWQQTLSSYRKVRLSPAAILDMLTLYGMTIEYNEQKNGMVFIIAVKAACAQVLTLIKSP